MPVPRVIPTDPICIAADELARFMKHNGYCICRGRVYKKAPDSRFTFVSLQSVEDFVLWSLGNGQVANAVASHVGQLTNLLTKPACRLIKPISIMYNYIEVLPPGTIFVISEKKFIKVRAFPENTSPRAFIKYTYKKDRVPYPKAFIYGELFSSYLTVTDRCNRKGNRQSKMCVFGASFTWHGLKVALFYVLGVTNSLPQRAERMEFYQKFYQILLHKKFPQKEPKLCLEGDVNSGKTSWMAPFEGIDLELIIDIVKVEKGTLALWSQICSLYFIIYTSILLFCRARAARAYSRCGKRRKVCRSSDQQRHAARFHGRMDSKFAKL